MEWQTTEPELHSNGLSERLIFCNPAGMWFGFYDFSDNEFYEDTDYSQIFKVTHWCIALKNPNDDNEPTN